MYQFTSELMESSRSVTTDPTEATTESIKLFTKSSSEYNNILLTTSDESNQTLNKSNSSGLHKTKTLNFY